MHGCQIFPFAFGIVKEDDASKRLELVDSLFQALEEIEQHFVSTKEPFFGGLNNLVLATTASGQNPK